MAEPKPCARTTQLLIEEAGDELLIYDQRDDHAHRLNATAAAVFRHADGTRTIGDLVDVLAARFGDVADEDLVLITLDGLAEANLIEDYATREAREARLSRRRFISRVGVVGSAALVLPIVHSIVAPTAAQAASCPPGYVSYHGSSCYYPYRP